MSKEQCPRCFEYNTTQLWKAGRKLQNHCYNCGDFGKPFTPQIKRLPKEKSITFGHSFEVFDKYNHIMMLSKKYPNRLEMFEDIQKQIEKGKNDKNAGPYTILIWSSEIIVHAEVIS